MIENSALNSIVNKETQRVLEEHRSLHLPVAEAVMEFNRKFFDIDIENVTDVFELCHSVDEKMEFSPKIQEVVGKIRNAVQESLIDNLFAEKAISVFGDVKRTREVDRQKMIAEVAARAITIIRKEKPKDLNQQWLQMQDSDLYRDIKKLITNKDTGVERWEDFTSILPNDIKKRFVIVHRVSTESDRTAIVEDLKEYADIARQLGPEAVAQLLISTGKVKSEDFEKYLKIISQYLGRCAIEAPMPGNVINYPDALLQLTEVRQLILVKLRNKIYQDLLGERDDISVEEARACIKSLKGEIEEMLGTRLFPDGISKAEVTSMKLRRELFEELMEYFNEVLETTSPPNMIETIRDKQGELRNFPSMRQRIAMKEMKDKRRQLIAFFMGKGKTATALLSKEHVEAKKMLYVCPPGELVEETVNKIHQYYKEGNMPTVGVIKSGMTRAELDEALTKEIVIFPYSMFSSYIDGGKVSEEDNEKGKEKNIPRGKERIVGIVKKQKFDFMGIDEVQYAKKRAGRNTKVVYELATEIDGLYENGYIASLSADPTPNSPDDIVAQLRIWDKETYGDIDSLAAAIRKGVHPLMIRNALTEYLLLIDKPEDWRKHLEVEGVDMHESERAVYSAIYSNEELTSKQKLELLYLCVINPELFSLNENVESCVMDAMIQKIDEAFETEDVVVIGENERKQGITREHSKYNGRSVVEKLRRHYGKKKEVLILDGDVKDKERREIFKAMGKKDGKKRIVVANANIIRHGIDLSHINRCIMLEPTYNKPDTIQLLKRFAREGNRDAKVTLIHVYDTVMQGIAEHADQKFVLTELMKHGGALTEDDVGLLSSDKLNEKVSIDGGKIRVGTSILEQVLTPRQKLARIFAYLHNKGAAVQKKHMEVIGKLIAELYVNEWEVSYSGNNARMVAGLISKLEKGGELQGGNYADVGCGPLILENTIEEAPEGMERTVFSSDINKYMLDTGKKIIEEKSPESTPRIKECSMHELDYEDGMFDLLNASLTLNYTKLNVRHKVAKRDERVKALIEYNRVLKHGGVMILTLPEVIGSKDELAQFKKALEEHFGFEIVPEYTGVGHSLDKDEDHVFKNNTIVCRKIAEPNLAKLDLKALKLSRRKSSSRTKGKEIKKRTEPKGCIHNLFDINDQTLQYRNNNESEEQRLLRERIKNARMYLREIFDEYKSFDRSVLPKNILISLSKRKIAITDIGSGAHFHFTDEVAEGGMIKSYSVE